MSALLNELLDPRQIALDLRARTQGEAIIEIAELLRGTGRVTDCSAFADAVMDRESRSSTNTGEGVAFPHARTNLVQEIVLGIGRSRQGVQFGTVHPPVHLIFLVGVPRRMVKDYLVCVGAIARVVKDETNRAALTKTDEPGEFIEIMRGASLLLE
jgi:mannitol/fructose-specific phosphotransferase system IIA component (Ntr-type)